MGTGVGVGGRCALLRRRKGTSLKEKKGGVEVGGLCRLEVFYVCSETSVQSFISHPQNKSDRRFPLRHRIDGGGGFKDTKTWEELFVFYGLAKFIYGTSPLHWFIHSRLKSCSKFFFFLV